jgi:hypothetical protein
MASPVKTYRVTRGTLKIGDSVRQYGDFVPEAESWSNKQAYLAAGYIEIAYVSQEDIDANVAAVAERETSEDVVYGDDAPKTVVDSSNLPKPKKKVAKSKTRVVKRGTKNVQAHADGNDSGADEAAGPVLAEASV